MLCIDDIVCVSCRKSSFVFKIIQLERLDAYSPHVPSSYIQYMSGSSQTQNSFIYLLCGGRAVAIVVYASARSCNFVYTKSTTPFNNARRRCCLLFKLLVYAKWAGCCCCRCSFYANAFARWSSVNLYGPLQQQSYRIGCQLLAHNTRMTLIEYTNVTR